MSLTNSYWSEYKNVVIPYIAGFVSKSVAKDLKKHHHCELCSKSLISEDEPCYLQILKVRGTEKQFLTTDSDDVVTICKWAEKTFKDVPNVLQMKNSILKLSMLTKRFLPRSLFKNLELANILANSIDVKNNHKMNLINKILEKYFTFVFFLHYLSFRHTRQSLPLSVSSIYSNIILWY